MSFSCNSCYEIHPITELRKAHAILYRPYELLDHPTSVSDYPGSQRIASIERLIASENFLEARHQSHELIKTTLDGLRYLETYDRVLIRTIVTFAYTGWIAFSAAFILAPSRPHLASSTPSWIPLLFSLTALGSCGLFAIQRLPWTFHIYVLFPFFFWQDVTRKVYANWSALRSLWFDDARWTSNVLLGLFFAVIGLQSMVVRHIPPSFSNLVGCSARDSILSLDTLTEWFGASVSSPLGLAGL
jgi:GPI ethanolamine phosphate transferase 1